MDIIKKLQRQNYELQRKIDELREEQRLIKEGGIDAVVVQGKKGEQIYSLENTAAIHIIESINEAFLILDRKWNYSYINKRAEKLLGFKREELLGKELWEVFPERKNAKEYKLARKAVKTGEIIEYETYMDRYQKWFLVKLYPSKNDLIVFFDDITERKHSQEEAQKAQSILAAIVTSSDDAIVSKNLNGIVTSWNKSAEEVFGYSAEEMIGQSIMRVIPIELQNEEKEIIRKLKKGQRIEHFQTVRLRKDGRRINVSLTISPVKNSDGKIVGASKIARDISEQKQTEKNLAFLADASKVLSSSLDYKTTLKKVTELAVPHIGDWCAVDILDGDNILEQVAISHVDPKKVSWAKEYRTSNPPRMDQKTGIPQAIKTGKSERYEVITDEMLVSSAKSEEELKLARELAITSAMIVPIIVKKNPIGAISFITTESKRKYLRADLAIAEELAARAALAIENAQLYQQVQRELEQRKILEKQKDEFIGVASHELKTPVTSIKSFAQVLRMRFIKEGNQNAADLLGKLDAQVDKLTSLIGDLLDVTKIEAGRMQFTYGNFSFDELVDELIEELQRTTEKHIIRKYGRIEREVFGDRDRVGQVITNLISNAIKYSPYSKEINVNVSAEKEHVKLSVQDFGIGIPRDKQEKVFERFFRASGPGQETFPGLGLGLYVSSEIIKRLNGKIWVESVAGKGSTFCFILPYKSKEPTLTTEDHNSNEKVVKHA